MPHISANRYQKGSSMIANRYISLIVGILTLFPSKAFADSPEETEQLMNEIKMNENILYGEDFNENKALASNNAIYELLEYANELRIEKGVDMLLASDIQTIAKELSYCKGNKHFVLVYLAIDEMYSLPKRKTTTAMQKKGVSQTHQATEQPSKPTVSYDYSSQKTIALIKAETTSSTLLSTKGTQEQDEILDILCSQDNWTEIKGFLTDFKSKGKIKETGFSQSASEVPEDAYSILIDEMYGILSILSPKTSTNRINYRTNQPDSEKNYSNCKVIVWYR